MKHIGGIVFLIGCIILIIFLLPQQPAESSPIPQERILPAVSAKSVYGNGDALVLYFRSVNGVNEGAVQTCPNGWTEVANGYGPHYVGVLNYETLQGGTGGTGGGFPGYAYDPPPITKEPTEPPSEPPPPPPSSPAGENPEDPEEPGTGGPSSGGDPPVGPTTPGGGYYPEEDPKNPYPAGFTPKDHMPFLDRLIKKVFAQPALTYYINAIGFGSDSVCAQTNLLIVNNKQFYQNTLSQFAPLYSDACFTDPVTGQVICNRCKVCVK